MAFIPESDIVPYHVSEPEGEAVLVLAPHPDDETLGMGGTIRLLLERGRHVRVAYLTSGEMADPSNKKKGAEYASMREKEALKAMDVLGVKEYEFMRFPDRGLWERQEAVLRRLSDIIRRYGCDTVYSPSPIELNPDHRAAASIALRLQSAFGIKVFFYEVAAPLRPSLLVDVTEVYKRKVKAIKSYKSQLMLMDYLKYITALNAFRGLTVSECGYVEAFWQARAPLSKSQMEAWLSYCAVP